ncbi:hypothetical protein H6P81_016343 [Aristolochia fimbriata]|uniref:Uncharacterized protein n=1 Tax=Aristolochia fimbriata TaxID=158543 RepID=A0AAV7E8G0_ARIFI|nr:hypothetical protein H6P81_016343 [Aristolochia fimbriata]
MEVGADPVFGGEHSSAYLQGMSQNFNSEFNAQDQEGVVLSIGEEVRSNDGLVSDRDGTFSREIDVEHNDEQEEAPQPSLEARSLKSLGSGFGILLEDILASPILNFPEESENNITLRDMLNIIVAKKGGPQSAVSSTVRKPLSCIIEDDEGRQSEDDSPLTIYEDLTTVLIRMKVSLS